MSDESMQRISERLGQYMREAGLISTPPRYRYYEGANGNMYCWTTETVDQADDDPKGYYASFIYRGYGKGSRSGKPETWKLEAKRNHRKRKDAKARAHKMLRRDNPA